MTDRKRADHRRGHVLAGGRRPESGSRGEFAFTVGRREIGHLHGDHAAHFGFPKQVWAELFEQKRIDYHPVFPGRPGFGARRIENEADVRDVIDLLRLNYDRVVAGHGLPVEAERAGDRHGSISRPRARAHSRTFRDAAGSSSSTPRR